MFIAAFALTAGIAVAQNTISVNCIRLLGHGTSETTLKDTVLMMIDAQKGGSLGRS